jgi:hypothetical protein
MEINGHHLAQDLADVLDFRSLDNAVAVLVEWGIINADVAANFMEDMTSDKKVA